MGEMFLGTFVEQNGLRIVNEPHDRMQEGSPPGRRGQALTDQDAFVAEIQAAMTPRHGHVAWSAFAHGERIGPELEGRLQSEPAQMGNRHGRRYDGPQSSA